MQTGDRKKQRRRSHDGGAGNKDQGCHKRGTNIGESLKGNKGEKMTLQLCGRGRGVITRIFDVTGLYLQLSRDAQQTLVRVCDIRSHHHHVRVMMPAWKKLQGEEW